MRTIANKKTNPSRDCKGAESNQPSKPKRQRIGRKLGAMTCALIACAFVPACKPTESTSQAHQGPPTVYTTFYPTTYFAQRIAGDTVKVVCPCPADADPAFWMPDDATIAQYQQADLIIINGASFEKWTTHASLPETRIVETTKPFESEYIVIKNAVTHSHGPSGKHSHSGIDGHTWLDPINAKQQAMQILDALTKKWPAHADEFKKGYEALASDLDKLDARLKEISPKLGERVLFCSHPAYNYLARRYDWQVKNFLLDPEEMPDDHTFEEIKSAVTDESAGLMVWEAQPLDEIEKRMQETCGLASVVYSPSESLDDSAKNAGEDFLTVMNANIDRLAEALTKG